MKIIKLLDNQDLGLDEIIDRLHKIVEESEIKKYKLKLFKLCRSEISPGNIYTVIVEEQEDKDLL